MAKVELIVPDKLSKIDPDLRDRLLTGAIREVASAQLREKEEELKEARKHVLEFEDKYIKNLEHFEKDMPEDADYKLHEDLVEWSFWNDVLVKAQCLVKDLRFVLAKTDEGNT